MLLYLLSSCPFFACNLTHRLCLACISLFNAPAGMFLFPFPFLSPPIPFSFHSLLPLLAAFITSHPFVTSFFPQLFLFLFSFPLSSSPLILPPFTLHLSPSYLFLLSFLRSFSILCPDALLLAAPSYQLTSPAGSLARRVAPFTCLYLVLFLIIFFLLSTGFLSLSHLHVMSFLTSRFFFFFISNPFQFLSRPSPPFHPSLLLMLVSHFRIFFLFALSFLRFASLNFFFVIRVSFHSFSFFITWN